ncbi:MAG TPA: ABC transporter C-terminal domain-containing protein, partial [Treponemataceae bacterium]|nr:ABC transporter C-terminal domain-containing protein [Treponemataceae bacterium]
RGGDARGVKAHSGGVKAGGTQAAGASFVEQRIINLEAEQRELESRMAAAYRQGDLARARTLGTKLDRTRREVERLYAAWE